MKLRSIFLPLLAFATLPMLAASPTATILAQDFDLLVEGTPDAPAENVISPIDPSLTNGQQWKGEGLHQAGGSLAVMQFEKTDWMGTNMVQGYVETPRVDVRLDGGKFSVSFRARCLNLTTTPLIMEAYDPYTTNYIDMQRVEISDTWQSYEVSLTHPGYGNHLVYLQMATIDGNWEIDDVQISQVYETVMPPMIHFAKNVTYESFTGYWNPVPMAQHYLVSAFELNENNERVYLVKDEITQECEYTVNGTVKGKQYYYTVRTQSDIYISEEAEPRKVNVPLSELDKPVSLEASNITQNSFTARWEATYRAMGYIINLKRKHISAGDEAFVVLREDFNKFTSYYPDYADPFYGNLDDYTSMPGWKVNGSAAYMDGMFAIDNSWKDYEEVSLETPTLDLSAADGKFTVKLKVKGSTGHTVHVTCGDASMSHVLTADVDEFALDFTNGSNASVIKFEFDDFSEIYGDENLFFDDIIIEQTVKAGELIVENVANYDTGAPVTEHTFENLNAVAGDIFEYTVTAWSYSFYEDGTYGPNIYSVVSDPQQVVIPDASGVDNVGVDSTASIHVSNGMLVVESANDEVLEVYSVAGQLLGTYNIAPGVNTIEAPAQGLIIARLGTNVSKLVVR